MHILFINREIITIGGTGRGKGVHQMIIFINLKCKKEIKREKIFILSVYLGGFIIKAKIAEPTENNPITINRTK